MAEKRKGMKVREEVRKWRWGEITVLSRIIWVDLTKKVTPEQRQNGVGDYFHSSPQDGSNIYSRCIGENLIYCIKRCPRVWSAHQQQQHLLETY